MDKKPGKYRWVTRGLNSEEMKKVVELVNTANVDQYYAIRAHIDKLMGGVSDARNKR